MTKLYKKIGVLYTFLVDKSIKRLYNGNMTVQNDNRKRRPLQLAMTSDEFDSLDAYLANNEIKLAPLVKYLLLKEVAEKGVLHELPEDYQLPNPLIIKKGVKKPRVQSKKK